MEKLFVKKLDDGKEFKIMVRLINNSVAVPFNTVCEYLGLSFQYWSEKIDPSVFFKTDSKILYIFLDKLQFRLNYINPRNSKGKYWKKVILGLQAGEMLFYNIGKIKETETINSKSEKISQKTGFEVEIQVLRSIILDKDKQLTETKDQLELVRNHNTDLQISLSNANDTIEFLTCKNKELKKQQRKLNQAIGIDLLNMAQQLLNIKEV